VARKEIVLSPRYLSRARALVVVAIVDADADVDVDVAADVDAHPPALIFVSMNTTRSRTSGR
jgi:hypothetical protein